MNCFTKTFIFIHPSFLFFFFIIVFSNLRIISSNSFFFSWVFLEINLISFIPLIINIKNKYSSEASLKYFFIQTVTSILILFSILTLKNYYLIFNLNILVFALIIKIAVAPCHQWIPSVSERLNWLNLFIFFSFQKINPLIILFSIIQKIKHHLLFLLYILRSAIIGRLGGLNQNSLRKILVYSSIAHIAWLLRALSISNWLWIFYFLIYCLILNSIIIIFHKIQVRTISQLYIKNKKLIKLRVTLTLLSLGGLPPFTGFFPKLFITQELFFHSFVLLFFLLSSTFVTLFFYIRIILPYTLIINIFNKSFSHNQHNNTFLYYVIFINIFAFLASPFFFIFF